jgi:hypothetical protein
MKRWENDNMVICGSNRWQEIKYAVNKDYGDQNTTSPYVRYRNQRIWLDEFVVSPHQYPEESALCGIEIHGAASMTYFMAYLLHINPHGDQAKVFAAWVFAACSK